MGLSAKVQINQEFAAPPALEKWGDLDGDPDLAHACSLFLGKNNQEIAPLLQKAYVIRCLDLAIMPDYVFEYYSMGFLSFILKTDHDDDVFGVFLGAFLDALSDKYRCSPKIAFISWMRLLPGVEKLYERLINSNMIKETKIELVEEFEILRKEALGREGQAEAGVLKSEPQHLATPVRCRDDQKIPAVGR